MPYKPKITTRGISTTTVTTDTIPKGSPMTNDEMDSNLLNLQAASIGIASDDSTVIDIGLGNTLRVVGSSGISTAVSGQTLTISSTGGGSTDLVNDLSPQLGGNLDINNFNIVSDSENIKIIPGPTGRIQLDNGIWPQAPGPTGAYLKTDGAGYSSGYSDGSTPDSLSWSYPTGWLDFDRQQSPAETNITTSYDTYWKLSGSTQLKIVDATSEVGVSFQDSGLATGGAASGKRTAISGGDGLYLVGTPVYIKSDNTVVGNTNNDHTITTFGTGNLTLSTNQGTNSGTITIVDGANSNITLTPNGTGSVVIDSISIKDNTISNNASDSDIQIKSAGTGTVDFSVPTSSTIGANGAASALTANPVGYLKIKINGTTYQLPYYNI